MPNEAISSLLMEQRIYNYHIYRTHIAVEHAFGRLKQDRDGYLKGLTLMLKTYRQSFITYIAMLAGYS